MRRRPTLKKKAFRIDEVARILSTSESQIYRLIQWGLLESPKSGTVSRLSLESFTSGMFFGMTYTQISELCGVSLRTVQRAVRNGKLDYFKINPQSRNNKSIRIGPTLKNVNYFLTYFPKNYRRTDRLIKQARKLLKQSQRPRR
jgi:excisionase family DNA binding protein